MRQRWVPPCSHQDIYCLTIALERHLNPPSVEPLAHTPHHVVATIVAILPFASHARTG
jgi:hypothetical protein